MILLCRFEIKLLRQGGELCRRYIFAPLLSSSYPLSTEKLGTLRFIFRQYDNVDEQIAGRAL